MSEQGHVTNPGARRVISSREKQKEWRARPEYKAASEAFLKKHPWCEVWLAVGIKVPATVVHHPNAWSYHSFALYIDFENNGAMAVSGTKGGGHYACHHNQKICPICKSKKCDIYAEGCQSCLCKKYPGLREHIDKIKRDRMDRSAGMSAPKCCPTKYQRIRNWIRHKAIGYRFAAKIPAKSLNLCTGDVGITLGQLERDFQGVRKTGRRTQDGNIWEVVSA